MCHDSDSCKPRSRFSLPLCSTKLRRFSTFSLAQSLTGLSVKSDMLLITALINKWGLNTEPTPINTFLCEGLLHSTEPSICSKALTNPQSSSALGEQAVLQSHNEIQHNTVYINLWLIQFGPIC